MNKSLLLLVFLLGATELALSQEKMEIEGAIIIKNSADPTPEAGTIRFNPNTKDFEGWNGDQWMSFTSLGNLEGVTDADGNPYTTVKIGTQEWMVQNLRTTKYNDNTPISHVPNNADWSVTETGAWCYYDNNSSHNEPYGKLYNWNAVNTGKLCPTGWHVPSDDEWTTLTEYLGGIFVAGGKMKATGTTHWSSPNMAATNESGFTGLPGGTRVPGGQFQNFSDYGYWWSRTEHETCCLSGLERRLYYAGGTITKGVSLKAAGRSVRCLRD